MPAISHQTRLQIKGYLEGFIQGLIDEYKQREIRKPDTAGEYLSRISTSGELKPFQAALIPSEIIRINQFERGLSTRIGNSIEECVRLIALEHHQVVKRSYDVQKEVSRSAFIEIERQKDFFEFVSNRGEPKPTWENMIKSVLNAQRTDDLETKSVRADIYIITKKGTEYIFELKSPKPNKGQCLEVTQRLLRFHLLLAKSPPQLLAYYAMPYNPYGFLKSDYKWSQAIKYTPFSEAVIIGNDFWNLIGGQSTYAELLDIYLEVGRNKSKEVLDTLAFGFY